MKSLQIITLCATLAILAVGCMYKGAKVVEGTDLAVGLTIPQTDGAAQMDVLNWLSGFRLGVAENCGLKVKYMVAETNDFLWGAASTRTWKTIDAKVEPCEVTPPQDCTVKQ
jgi:hypothetical protein